MLDALGNTISKPWREEMPLKDLVLWAVVFAIVAFVVYDMLRILSSWMAQSVAN